MTRDDRVIARIGRDFIRAVEKARIRPSPELLEQLASAGLELIDEGKKPTGDACLRRARQNVARLAIEMISPQPLPKPTRLAIRAAKRGKTKRK